MTVIVVHSPVYVVLGPYGSYCCEDFDCNVFALFTGFPSDTDLGYSMTSSLNSHFFAMLSICSILQKMNKSHDFCCPL